MIRNFSWVIPGRLAGSALPGAGFSGEEYILSDLRELQEAGVRLLVSLTNQAADFGPLCRRVGLEWIFFPIMDFDVPADRSAFDRLITELVQAMDQEKAVCVHCYAGIGRSGLVLSCLVGRYLGLPADKALGRVRRGRPALETPEQEQFLRSYLADRAPG